jgi:hypothetical protein
MRQSKNKDTTNDAIRLVVLTLCLFTPLWTGAQKNHSQRCAAGAANCFFAETPASLPSNEGFEHTPLAGEPSRVVPMLMRESHGGPFAHHWIELESSRGPVTIHFGPATIPFIDLGQISVLDAHGDLETRPHFHILSEHYDYAKAPGSGRIAGKPLYITVAQADALIAKERSRKFIGPYIPIFHDCRTFVCTAQATAQGKSTLPCYFLFKGYW